MKAPFSSLRCAAELLEEDLSVADRARFLNNLRAETQRIQCIVDRLLELAALEARHGRLALASVDPREIAGEVVAGAGVTAAARRIVLRLEDGPPAPVKEERFLLAQAVSNLVQNALKFTPAGRQ